MVYSYTNVLLANQNALRFRATAPSGWYILHGSPFLHLGVQLLFWLVYIAWISFLASWGATYSSGWCILHGSPFLHLGVQPTLLAGVYCMDLLSCILGSNLLFWLVYIAWISFLASWGPTYSSGWCILHGSPFLHLGVQPTLLAGVYCMDLLSCILGSNLLFWLVYIAWISFLASWGPTYSSGWCILHGSPFLHLGVQPTLLAGVYCMDLLSCILGCNLLFWLVYIAWISFLASWGATYSSGVAIVAKGK